MNKTIAAIILALAISLVACKSGEVTKTSWHLEFKNGIDGPSGVLELSADGSRILRTLSVGTVTNSILWEETIYITNKVPITVWSLDGVGTKLTNTIDTNWLSIGTFTPTTGTPEDVQRGNIVTNTTAVIEWKGIRHEFILESTPGPDCGERRMPDTKTWLWRSLYSPGVVVTNILLNDLIPHEQQGFAITNSVWIDHIEGTNIGPWIQVMTNSNHNYNLETKW